VPLTRLSTNQALSGERPSDPEQIADGEDSTESGLA